MLKLEASRAELHAADNRAARSRNNRVHEIVKPKIEFRLDNFVDVAPSTERRYVERREDLVNDCEEFLVGYTKKLLEMRDSHDPRVQQAWNSKFAQEDRMLLQDLLGEKTDFGGVPGEADQATRIRAQEYLKTNRGWTMATDALVRQVELSYRVQGLSVPRGDTQVATETRTFTGGVSTGREGLMRFKAEVSGYFARHKLARGLKYVQNLWEGDQRVQYNSEILRALQNNPTEATYAYALTGIDVTKLTPTADGIQGLPVDATDKLIKDARKNLDSARKFYKSLGIEADPLTRPQELTINRKAQEIFETRVTSLTRKDTWGQDASNVCYLRQDCAAVVPHATVTEGGADVGDIFKRVQQVREGRARGALPTDTYLDTTYTPPVPLSDKAVAELFAAAEMENVDITTGLAPHFTPNAADILRARQNIAEGKAAKDRLATGRPAMTVAEVDLVRARAVPREIENYFLDLPVVPPATAAQRQAVIQENAAREEEIFRLRRESHAAAISNVAMEQYRRMGAPRNETIEQAKVRLEARKAEIQKGTGTEIEKLQREIQSIEANENAVTKQRNEHVHPLEEARAEVKRLEDQGVNELGVARSGDFTKNIDEVIRRVNDELVGRSDQRVQEVHTAYEQYAEKKREEDTARGTLGAKVEDRSLSGDVLVKKADDLIKEKRDRIGKPKSGRSKATGLIAEQEGLNDPASTVIKYFQKSFEDFRYDDLRAQFKATKGRDPDSGEDISLHDEAARRARPDTLNAVQGRKTEISQQIASLNQEIAEVEGLRISYENAVTQSRVAEDVIVKPAANEYDLVKAADHYDNFINATKSPGTKITAKRLRSSAEPIEDLVKEIEADSNKTTNYPFLAGSPPVAIDQLREMLIQARTEQAVIDKALDKGSDPASTTAFNKIVNAIGLTPVSGKVEVNTYFLTTLTIDDLATFFRENYGATVDRDKLELAQNEARKQLRSRYETYIDTKKAAKGQVDTEALTAKRNSLVELKNNYANAKTQLAEAETRAAEASGSLDIATFASEYAGFLRFTARRTGLTLRNISADSLDSLVVPIRAAVAAGRFRFPRAAGTTIEQQNAWLKDRLMEVKVEYASQVVENTTEISPAEQLTDYDATVAGGGITHTELLLEGNDAELLKRLHDPTGPYKFSADVAERVLKASRAEASKKQRIRYEALLKEQVKEFGRQKQSLDEQIRKLNEEQQKKVPEIEALQTMMSDYDRLPQAALDIATKIDTYTAQAPLNDAGDPEHKQRTDKEYEISSAATGTPSSYVEFLDLIMNCGKAGDRNACFIEGNRLLDEGTMVNRMIATLPLLDTAGNRLAAGTTIQDTIQSLERGVKGGQINPKHLHDFLVSTIEDFAKHAGVL